MLPASKPSIWRIPPLHILYLWVEQMSFWVKNVKKNQEKSHRECSTEETWWRQTLMSMIGNDDKEGNDVIEDIDILCPCHILLPYPDASAYALAPYPLRNLPQSQCFALALYCNEEVKNI